MSYKIPFIINEALISQGFAVCGIAGSTGANVPFVQIWNPSSSSKIAILNTASCLNVSTTLAGCTAYHSTALLSGTVGTPTNKFMGSAVTPNCVVTTGVLPSIPTAPIIADAPSSSTIPASLLMQPGDALVMPPNSGILVVCGLAASTLVVNLAWSETT